MRRTGMIEPSRPARQQNGRAGRRLLRSEIGLTACAPSQIFTKFLDVVDRSLRYKSVVESAARSASSSIPSRWRARSILRILVPDRGVLGKASTALASSQRDALSRWEGPHAGFSTQPLPAKITQTTSRRALLQSTKSGTSYRTAAANTRARRRQSSHRSHAAPLNTVHSPVAFQPEGRRESAHLSWWNDAGGVFPKNEPESGAPQHSRVHRHGDARAKRQPDPPPPFGFLSGADNDGSRAPDHDVVGSMLNTNSMAGFSSKACVASYGEGGHYGGHGHRQRSLFAHTRPPPPSLA